MNAPDHRLTLGRHTRDTTTGIAGRVTAVCFNEHEDTQYRIRRHGVDSSGKPFDQVWVYASHCENVTEAEAREL